MEFKINEDYKNNSYRGFKKLRGCANALHGKKGLREKMRDATSETELNKLIAAGATYHDASAQTKREWQRTSQATLARLKVQKEKNLG